MTNIPKIANERRIQVKFDKITNCQLDLQNVRTHDAALQQTIKTFCYITVYEDFSPVTANHSLEKILAQILDFELKGRKLRAASELHRQTEIDEVVKALLIKIEKYQLTALELGFKVRQRSTGAYTSRRKKSGSSTKQTKITGKTYRGLNGEIWVTGTRGRKPRWVDEQNAGS